MSLDISMDRYILNDIYGNYMIRNVDVVVSWITMVKSRFDALLIYYGINHVKAYGDKVSNPPCIFLGDYND